MLRKEIVDALSEYTDPFRVMMKDGFPLKGFDLSNTLGLKLDKKEAAQLLKRGSEWLAMEHGIQS